LLFEIVANDTDRRAPWTGVHDADEAVRGIHSVTMMVRDAGPSVDFLTHTLGYRVIAQSGNRTRTAVGGDTPGHFIDVVEDNDARTAVNGLGTVHHVAMAIGSDAEQRELQQALAAAGVGVTDVRDRTYFRSIYFREPGGVLFEVATVQPGFTFDEPLATLGRELKLPDWEEPHRASIERNLAAVSYD
jgi:glyoxalase family protein